MRMANCERCGKLFVAVGGNVCPECREYEDKCLRRAREILLKEPGLGVLELVERLGEPLELVEKFIREGRLRFAKNDDIQLNCEICGRRITEGKRCPSCELRMRKMAREAFRAGGSDSKNRMHSLETIKMREERKEKKGGAP